MDPVTLGLIGYGVGTLGSMFGAHQANKENRREAQRNRDFQERMRNTEWQAAVADMQAAGINPALAYARGGASSPSGSMAAPANDVIGSGVSSAMQSIRLKSELALMKAQLAKTEAEGDAARSLADREAVRNLAYGFERRPDGSISIDYSMPGIVEETKAMVAERVAAASRAASMAEISGVGAGAAGAIGQVLPTLDRAVGVASGGLESTITLLERAVGMSDDAVRASIGISKSAARALLARLRRGVGKLDPGLVKPYRVPSLSYQHR